MGISEKPWGPRFLGRAVAPISLSVCLPVCLSQLAYREVLIIAIGIREVKSTSETTFDGI